MTDALPPSLQAIRDNEDFVRRLAQSLIRDPAAADDLAQDAWLTAMRQPARPVDSLRGWLASVMRNRAQDLGREKQRRARREAAAARSEIDERERRASERVEVQKRVLDAVMLLPEAQRTAILLHHLEQLSCEEIARRRGVTASTVRAQVSRGLDALREKLDRDFGERGAWSAALLALLAHGERTSLPFSAAKLAAAVVVASSVGIGTLAIFASQRGGAIFGDALEPLATTPAAANVPSPSELEDPGETSLDATRSSRKTQSAQARWTVRPDRSDLEAASIDDLLVLGRMTQRTIAAKLLAVSDEERAPAICFTKFPDSGVGRVLERGKFAFSEPYQRPGDGEFGCYLSFATGSNASSEMPTLMLEGEKFRGATRFAAFAQLGYQDIALISAAADAPPPPGVDATVWEFLWSDAKIASWDVDATFVARARELRLGSDTAAFARGLWLVRAIAPGEYDLLAVFASLGADENGHSIGWRVLERWPVEMRPRSKPPESAALPAEPQWLADFDLVDLYAFQDGLREVGEARLTAVPDDLRVGASADDSEGVARLLHRERFGALIGKREAGAYFSFATRSNHFDDDTDLGLQDGLLQSLCGGGGRFGWLVDCGDVPLRSIGGLEAAPPAPLDTRAREAWKLQRTASAAESRVGERSPMFSEQFCTRVREQLRATHLKPFEGHTYSIRSRVDGEHDLLAAFRIERMDEHGVWIVWRVLERWDASPRPEVRDKR